MLIFIEGTTEEKREQVKGKLPREWSIFTKGLIYCKTQSEMFNEIEYNYNKIENSLKEMQHLAIFLKDDSVISDFQKRYYENFSNANLLKIEIDVNNLTLNQIVDEVINNVMLRFED